PVDEAKLLHRVGGDAELLAELIDLFLGECPKLLGEIRSALTAQDGNRLRRAAHALKGSAGNFDASAAYDAAARLEEVGRGERWADAGPTLAALEAAVGDLERALRAMTNALPVTKGNTPKG